MTTKDSFFPNSPTRCQEGSIAVSLRHSQSTVSDLPTPSGKSSICKIESVTGKYKILPASSFILDYSTQRTNKSGYFQDHVGLLLAFNGRNDINYDAKHYYSFKGVSDKRPPLTEKSTSNIDMIIQNGVCIMNNGIVILLTPPGTNKSVINSSIDGK
ncbi:hypothetical protein ALC53_08068 [Atta colombica]|uniref:Uncharacterized protein n=1 Tax=Atta colombica TaxID=520822 RepID=A0A151I313_9HYME|nr:hypothetical protein ALC53_08068 [Atta colombica]